MPFLDWVNKAQAQRTSANVPYHLLQFQSAHGDPAADNLLILAGRGVAARSRYHLQADPQRYQREVTR